MTSFSASNSFRRVVAVPIIAVSAAAYCVLISALSVSPSASFEFTSAWITFLAATVASFSASNSFLKIVPVAIMAVSAAANWVLIRALSVSPNASFASTSVCITPLAAAVATFSRSYSFLRAVAVAIIAVSAAIRAASSASNKV